MNNNDQKINKIEETLSEIKTDKEKEVKQDKLWFKIRISFLIISILLVIPVNWWISNKVKELTEKEFLDKVGKKTMEVAPYITREFGEKTKEVAPKAYAKIEDDIKVFVEKTGKDINKKYIPEIISKLKGNGEEFIENSTKKTKERLNNYLSGKINKLSLKIENNLKNSEELESLNFKEFMNTERKKELKNLIREGLNINKKFVDDIKNDLNLKLSKCIENSKDVFHSIKSYENLPKEQKGDYIFSMLRGFVNGLEYINKGKLPDSYKEQENLNIKEIELYNTYLRKSKFGEYKITNLKAEPWWNKYDQETKENVKNKIKEKLGQDL